MEVVKHETCQQYVARRLSEGWEIVSRKGFNVILQSPEGILRPVDLRNDVETLRPDGDGDLTQWEEVIGADTHWEAVDEESSDGDTTYIEASPHFGDEHTDLFTLEDHSVGAGTINHVTVYVVVKSDVIEVFEIRVKTHDTEYPYSFTQSTDWVSRSQQLTNNPNTSSAWTWDEVDALQVGLRCYESGSLPKYAYCTQVYVEVDYTPAAPPGLENKSANMAAKMVAAGLI